MDTSRMEKIYQEIVEKVADIIQEDWTKVYLYGEITDGVRKSYFNYYPKDNNKPVYCNNIPELFNIDEDEYDKLWCELLDSLQELWLEFKKNGEEVWTNLTLTIDNIGKFKIDYSYEDLTNADDYERHIIWDYKYLGLTPEDEDDKEVLEEYLKNAKTDISRDI